MDDEEKRFRCIDQTWDYLRHLDTLRVRLATFYIVAVVGPFVAVLKEGTKGGVRWIALVLGLATTLFCWMMTEKWNGDFRSMMQNADRCARTIPVRDGDEVAGNIHQYLPFPPPHRTRFNVRLAFRLLYAVFFGAWLSLMGWFVVR